MKKLKIISLSNKLIYILLVMSILITIITINIPIKYNKKQIVLKGYVINKKVTNDKITIYLKSKEKILVNYYCKDKIDDIMYGDYIKIKGKINIPNNNSNFNLFNYRKYLLSQKIKYIVSCNELKIIQRNNNIFYKIKNKLINRICQIKKTGNYIMTFVMADKNYIDESIKENYQNLGISHILAVSGMHVSFIAYILTKILFFISENKRYFIISIILIIYLFLTNFTISMMRSCIQYMLLIINNKFKLKIKTENIIIFLFSVFLLYNPFYIYNIGFLFTFIISFSLVIFNKLLDKKNKMKNILIISFVSFLISIPVVVNNFYQINFFNIINNIIFIPFVSLVIFPLSILTLIFPFFDNINYFFINILEKMSNIFNINLGIPVARIPMLLILLYYLITYRFLINVNKKNAINLMIILLVIIFNGSVIFNKKIIFLDVGQGDSILIRNNKNILIDTGGNINYNLYKNVLIPSLKSNGIKKLDYLILTHGDFDHMGEAINLVNNFKVEKVIFNCGEFNDLEKELIKVLDKKKIKYYSCIKELNIDDNKLYFLQTKEYDNENDNSNVIYTELNGYKFMFMGDAGVDKEKDILDKYNLSNIDVLKVGHHGSKTSSSKAFIDDINPKYSIISVGKNNRYGHPNKEVLNNLENSKIYRTDQDGSIMFKIKNNKLKIDTCNP